MIRSRMAPLIALAVLVPCVGYAERVEHLQQGARVRMTSSHGGSTVGNLQANTRDSLTVSRENSAVQTTVGFADITRIDVSRGRSHALGALIGAAVGVASGLVIGGVLGAATYQDGQCDFFVCSRGQSAGFVAVLGGTAGIILGTVSGAIGGIESWTTIDRAH